MHVGTTKNMHLTQNACWDYEKHACNIKCMVGLQRHASDIRYMLGLRKTCI